MSKTISKTMSEVGNSVEDAAKSVGSKIAEGAEKAVDFVKEKTGMGTIEGDDVGVGGIREHMNVIASCGKKVGVVDGVEMNSIKLTRKDSPDDQHHFIPLSWISHVDSHVHLNKNSKEAAEGWKSNASSCGCGTADCD
ncbi:MAG TPA: DUF2171 domain-containing protein [Pirellula sp.]|nr:DUF2171 domain-containing protein [Pirellula sp.]